jgi:hypothetical protein
MQNHGKIHGTNRTSVAAGITSGNNTPSSVATPMVMSIGRSATRDHPSTEPITIVITGNAHKIAGPCGVLIPASANRGNAFRNSRYPVVVRYGLR